MSERLRRLARLGLPLFGGALFILALLALRRELAFHAYSMSQTLGLTLFTGGAIRYRFWSSWGLSAGEIARGVGFAGLTLWLGLVALLGTAMLVDTATLATLIRLHPLVLRLLGSPLLAAGGGYLP